MDFEDKNLQEPLLTKTRKSKQVKYEKLPTIGKGVMESEFKDDQANKDEGFLQNPSGCRSLKDEEDKISNKGSPQAVFNSMCEEFSQQKLMKIQKNIEPYKLSVDDKAFVTKELRMQLEQEDGWDMDSSFTTLSQQFFCKFEFIKNVKKGYSHQMNCDTKESKQDTDRHFLLVKTWQRICFQQVSFEDGHDKNDYQFEHPNIIKQNLKIQKDDINLVSIKHKQNPLDHGGVKRKQGLQQKFDIHSIQSEDHDYRKGTNTSLDEKKDLMNTNHDQSISQNPNSVEECHFYIKTIQIFDDSINLMKEIMVEMIPVEPHDNLESYDTSTLVYSNKLYFFRREFQDNHGQDESMLKLFVYNFATNEVQIVEDFENSVIDEVEDEVELLSSDHEQIKPRRIGHKHLLSVLFSEQFGEHENVDVAFQQSLIQFEKQYDEEEEEELNKYEEMNQNKKENAMNRKICELETKFLKEQFIIFQSYYIQHNNCDEQQCGAPETKWQALLQARYRQIKFTNTHAHIHMFSLNDLQEGMLHNFFVKNDKIQISKVEQIFHIKNFEKQPNIVHFITVERDKITQFVINECRAGEVEHTQEFYFDENHNKNQQIKTWFQIKIKSIILQNYNENDQKIRIEQYYFIDEYNQIQLLFPLYSMKLEKMKIKDLITNQIKFEEKDPSLYKMINRVTDVETDKDDAIIFQSYTYLKLILPNLKPGFISQDMEISFVQHGYHQYIMINSKQAQEEFDQEKQNLIFYTLKENDQFYHLCQPRNELLSDRGFENIRYQNDVKHQQQGLYRRETLEIGKLKKLNYEQTKCHFESQQQDEKIHAANDQARFYDQKDKKELFEQNHPNLQYIINQSIKKAGRDPKERQIQNRQQFLYDLKNDKNDDNKTFDRGIDTNKSLSLNEGLQDSEDQDTESIESHMDKHKIHMIDTEGNKVDVRTHDSSDFSRDVILLINQKVGDVYQFVFVIEHKYEEGNNNYQIKNKTYFFLQKKLKDMKVIFKGDRPIIRSNEKVMVLRGIKEKEDKFKFEDIDFGTVMSQVKQMESDNEENEQADKNEEEVDDNANSKAKDKRYYDSKKIKLSYAHIQNKSPLNFIPFIYQEANKDKNNRLIVFDIGSKKIVSSIIINPPKSSMDYIHINENDNIFKSYQICFSSEVEEIQGLGKLSLGIRSGKGKIQNNNLQVKLSLATFFQEQFGRIQIQEFLIKNGPQAQSIKVVSIKQLFFSKELIQLYQQSGYIKNSYIMPFHSQQSDQIKGLQLMWHKEINEDERDQNGNLDEQIFMFINLLDQDKNNIYQYETKIASFGQKKYMLNPHNPEIYAIAIVAMLKKEVLEKNIFENMETVMILTVINEITAGIKIADLRYLMLSSFETMKSKDFFKNQEIFFGKSFCDICLNDADEIERAIQGQDEKDVQDEQWPKGSHIYKLCQGDQQRLEIMEKTGFYKKDLIIQQDYNFDGTINKAIKQKSFQALKILMQHVLVDLNEHVYYDLIMFNLRQLLECSKIEINEFFERTITEKKNRNDEGFCNLEIAFKNIKLPGFSEKANEFMKVPVLNDFNVWKQEIEEKIQNRDKISKDDSKKNYEIEHSYIDFQQMIIGEKIRAFEEGIYNYEFNDFKLCKLMRPNSESLEFYKGQTIQRIVSYQWQKSKIIYKWFLYIFTFLFAIPFTWSQLTPDRKTKTNALKVCLVPMIVMLFIEITYICQMGRKYCKISTSYGLILIICFFTYVIPELQGVFLPEVEANRLKNKQWNPNEFLPELLLTILLLSFARLLQYIRVYDEFGFFIQMFILCVKDLETFIISFITFLVFFTICYICLNIESIQDVSHDQGTGYFEDMFMGTYRSAIGELSMPEYANLNAIKPMTTAVQINIYLIWVLYIFQSFLMAIVFLNFIIAVISSTYNRVMDYKTILKFKQQASINDECFQLVKVFSNCFKRKDQFKVLVFSSSIENNVMEEDQFEDMVDQLKKFVTKQNKDLLHDHTEINKLITDVKKNQMKLENMTVKKFDELDNNQSKISKQIIDGIQKKTLGQSQDLKYRRSEQAAFEENDRFGGDDAEILSEQMDSEEEDKPLADTNAIPSNDLQKQEKS